MRRRTPNERACLEPNLPELFGIDKEAAIEHERGLVHLRVYGLPVYVTELRPLRRNDHCLCVLARLHRGLADRHLPLDLRWMRERGA